MYTATVPSSVVLLTVAGVATAHAAIHCERTTKQHDVTTVKGAELCRSYNYAHKEIRAHHTRDAAITSATSSAEANLRSAAVDACAFNELAPEYLSELLATDLVTSPFIRAGRTDCHE